MQATLEKLILGQVFTELFVLFRIFPSKALVGDKYVKITKRTVTLLCKSQRYYGINVGRIICAEQLKVHLVPKIG